MRRDDNLLSIALGVVVIVALVLLVWGVLHGCSARPVPLSTATATVMPAATATVMPAATVQPTVAATATATATQTATVVAQPAETAVAPSATATAPPLPTITPAPDVSYHRIVAGDTYWDQAQKWYGARVCWQTLRMANGWPERLLPIGEDMLIPGGCEELVRGR